MTDKYPICFAGTNPSLDGLEASESAANAISENPRNASLTIPISNGPLIAPTDRPSLAMFTSKFWIAGRQLKISFLTGTDWQKNKVKQYATAWCSYGNIGMTFVDTGDCDILIDFNPTLGSWSYVGTDCSYFANRRVASMNLGWVLESKSEAEIRQVILHEFGHSLGAVHEHESPFVEIPWNKPKVYADLGGPPNNWPPAKVDRNMFTAYNLQQVQGTPFDGASVMLYYFPPSWTLNDKGTSFNTDLSDGDKAYIHFVYPPDSLDAGQFNTMEVRPWNQPRVQNTKTKYLWKKYPTAPRLPLGLTSLDIDCGWNIRITASATDISQETFTAGLNAWADTVLYSAGFTYVEAGPGFEYLQTGTFNTQEVGRWQDHAPKNSKRINFPTPFEGQAPRVICWLNSVDMDKRYNWRCTTYATDIDANGFTVHIDTWADTVMYSAGMTWLAYPSDLAGVSSGSFNTQDVRPWSQPQHDNSANVSFSTNFTKVPKLIMALNGFDYDHSKNLRLRLSTSSVTQTGMTWHLQSWYDSIMYSAGASYFAWA
jgi:hypothetical protein